LATFSRVQENSCRLALDLSKACSATAIIVMPVYAILGLTGGDLVHVFASEKWQHVEGLIPWLSLSGLVTILWTPALSSILAIGRPGLVSIVPGGVFCMVATAILVVEPSDGLQAVICWTLPIVLAWPANLALARYTLGVNIREQLAHLGPAFLATGCIMGAMLGARSLFGSGPSHAGIAGELGTGGIGYLLLIATMTRVLFRRAESAERPALMRAKWTGEAQ
jgi:O-antigen/teichoic acid export membrane protein